MILESTTDGRMFVCYKISQYRDSGTKSMLSVDCLCFHFKLKAYSLSFFHSFRFIKYLSLPKESVYNNKCDLGAIKLSLHAPSFLIQLQSGAPWWRGAHWEDRWNVMERCALRRPVERLLTLSELINDRIAWSPFCHLVSDRNMNYYVVGAEFPENIRIHTERNLQEAIQNG